MPRGHTVILRNGRGYYEDGEPTPTWGGEERPCTKCGLTAEPNGPDPCLGWLPGVKYACCGHGNPEYVAYVAFENGKSMHFYLGEETEFLRPDGTVTTVRSGEVVVD